MILLQQAIKLVRFRINILNHFLRIVVPVSVHSLKALQCQSDLSCVCATKRPVWGLDQAQSVSRFFKSSLCREAQEVINDFLESRSQASPFLQYPGYFLVLWGFPFWFYSPDLGLQLSHTGMHFCACTHIWAEQ